jgi:hypothetical protein
VRRHPDGGGVQQRGQDAREHQVGRDHDVRQAWQEAERDADEDLAQRRGEADPPRRPRC